MAARRFTGTRRVAAFLAVITLLLGAATFRVATVATSDLQSKDDLQGAAVAQLRFLRSALDRGAGERMQELFPEGYFFAHVLYGLAWTEPGTGPRVAPKRARSEGEWALAKLSSAQGTAPFDPALRPTYGVFYAGWSLLLRSQVAAVQPDQSSSAERTRIHRDADAIAAALTHSLDESGSPFLLAYPDGSWPVDTVVAVAALRAADAAVGTDHIRLIERWLAALPARLDPSTGLLPHRVDARTGRALEGARGSSQSLIQRFWPAVDPAGASDSYRRFREQFVTREQGFVGVREYPRGVSGAGDVDSGPLVLGLSLSASAVAIGAALANGDRGLAVELAREAEVLGVPVTWQGERRYAAGLLPVGDAFVAWARVTAPAPAVAGLPATRSLWMWWLALPWLALLSWWSALYAYRRSS